MVTVLIAYSGGGKTHKIKEELVNRYSGHGVKQREAYAIEREDSDDYSGFFNENYLHVLKPSSDISFLNEKKDCDIFVDCEDDSDTFLEKIAKIIENSKKNNNSVTITFLEYWSDLSEYGRSIIENADQVYVGKCALFTEQIIESIFHVQLRPVISKYGFRRIK